ncbi:MAG: GNAT family N-acetyltransferase [Pseudomonadota bacterium]
MIALAPTPTLRTERLTLRAPQGEDWPAWKAFCTSDRAHFIRPDDSPRTAWRAFGHVIGHWAMRGFGSFVFYRHDDPTPIGMSGPWFPEGWPETEIGWTIWSPECEGQGYAAEAATAALAFARDTLNWQSDVSYVHPDNHRSAALAARLGATPDPEATAPGEDDLVYRHWGPA